MTDIAGTMDDGIADALAPFEVDDLRRVLEEVELADIIDELVEAFLDDAPARMDAIGAAVESAVHDQIRTTAHAYKSAAASMGARRLADLLRQLELAGAEGDDVRAAALLPVVRVAHDTVVGRLREAFES